MILILSNLAFFLLPINANIVSPNYKAHYHTKRIIFKFKNASHNLKLLFSKNGSSEKLKREEKVRRGGGIGMRWGRERGCNIEL